MPRPSLRWLVPAALLVAFLLPSAAGAEPAGEQTFYPSPYPQGFVVPEGVHELSMSVRGASGSQGSHTGPSGLGALVEGSFAVTPGETLYITVADGNGHGYGEGGSHGTAPGRAYDGAVGGGASAVGTSSELLIVAGGGGGGGGDDDSVEGGYGGNAGEDLTPIGPGRPPGVGGFGTSSAGGESYENHNSVGGCAGCEPSRDGGSGDSDHNIFTAPGGGGGGGAGFHGGGGGEHGEDEGGAGGGAGASFVQSGAVAVTMKPFAGCKGEPEPACEGRISISWGAPPAKISVLSGEGQAVPLTEDFGPVEVLAESAIGTPVSGAPITFSLPTASPSGALPGGTSTVVVETDSRGIATLYGLAAGDAVGPWILSAETPEVATRQIPLANRTIPTLVVVQSSPNPSTAAETPQISARVAGTAGQEALPPTGSVQFEIDGTATGAPVELAPNTGIAVLPVADVPPLLPGLHAIGATYLGDAVHAPETARGLQEVEAEPGALTVEGLPNPVSDGSALDLVATLLAESAGAPPSGNVQFEVDGSVVGTAPMAGGTSATLHLASLPLGEHQVDAVYEGDLRYAAARGEAVEAVGDAALASVLSSSANPSTFGAPATVEAELRRTEAGPDAVGTVDFTVDGNPVCTAVPTAGARAVCRLPADLAAGEHSVHASFVPAVGSGDGPATGAMRQLVVPMPTRDELVASPTAAILGAPFALSSTVRREDGVAATGTVQLQLDRGRLGGPIALASGHAAVADACAIASPLSGCPLAVGAHAMTSEFIPADGNLRPSRAAALVQVEAEPTVTAVRPAATATAGAAISFLATVSAPSAGPEGAVQFLLDGRTLGAPVAVVGGTAVSKPSPPLASGPHKVVAHFLGGERFKSSEKILDFRADPSADAAKPKLRLLDRVVRVRTDGSVPVRVACDGAPGTTCEGRVELRPAPAATGDGDQALLARTRLSLPAGSTASRRLRLSRSGRGMFDRRLDRAAVVRFVDDGVESRLLLRATSAPRLLPLKIRIRGHFAVVRLRCLQGKERRCQGEVALGGDGHRLGSVHVAAGGRAPFDARLRLPDRYLSSARKVRVSVRSEVPVGRARISARTQRLRP